VLAACVAAMVLAGPLGATAPGAVVINEMMASNSRTKADPQGQFDDWIEIHNAGDTLVNVGGMYLTDDPDEPTKWQIPADVPGLTYIIPRGHLLIWADGHTKDPGLHASFKLSAGGEELALVDTDGTTLIDSVSFPTLGCDVSYGRSVDGGPEWRFFAAATPGAANAGGYEGAVAPIEFSRGHGFCEESFSVSLATETPEALIYYTLDGETPGVGQAPAITGTLYTGPIPIEKTTCLRAVALRPGWKPSAVHAQTYIFVADVVKQSPTGAKPEPGWPEPVAGNPNSFGGPQVIDYGMDPDVVNDPRYKDLVDDALLSIPTISLVTPLANLFDPKVGIYVNALQDGRDWERPVSIELIHPDGTEGFQVNAGLRIRGGYGRLGENAKHGFRLFFRAEYGMPELHYPLFGNEGVDKFEKIDLRAEQNYSWAYRGDLANDPGSRNTMLRDVFCRDLQGATGQPYTRSRYYHLYINGHYWGIFQSQERAEARFAESYFGGESDDYDVVKVDAGPGRFYTVHTTDGNLDAYTRLWQVARNGFDTDVAYYRVQGLNPDGTPNPAYERLLDVDNLIDYMICTLFVGDIDGPISSFIQNSVPNNFYAIYNRTNPDGFKFFRHDCEHTMLNVHEDRTGPFPAGQNAQHFNPQWLHERLTANAEYRTRFADRVYRHFFNDGVMTPEAAADLLKARKDAIDLAVIAESARWGDTKMTRPRTRDDDWLPEVNFLLNEYLPKRTGIVLSQLRTRSWYSNLETPAFNQHGGAVDSGFKLTMSAPIGFIYYSTDGADPRLPREAINTAHAKMYAGPITLTESTRVRARTFFGRWSAIHDVVFAVGPVAESLRISEIMYHPASEISNLKSEISDLKFQTPETEYIELTNIGTETINLNFVRFTKGIDFTFPSTPLAPGGHCLVVKDRAAFEAKYGPGLPVAGQYLGSLANEGERIELLDAAGRTIHNFKYDDDWYDRTDGPGYSLTIVDPTHPDVEAWSQKDAWRPSTQMHGSPGGAD
jgi:hypothetical protein